MDYRTCRKFAIVAACAVILPGCDLLRHGSAPPPSYSKTQVFERSCDAMWPQLIGAIGEAGFRPMQSDRAAGIANFLWNSASLPVISGVSGGPALLAIGSFEDSTSLRVESALLMLRPEKGRCTASLAVSYKGRESGFWNKAWIDVESSGLLENRLLAGTPRGLGVKRFRGASAEYR